MYYSLVVFINEGPNFNPENLGFMKHKIVNAHPYYSYMISHDLTDLTPNLIKYGIGNRKWLEVETLAFLFKGSHEDMSQLKQEQFTCDTVCIL